VTNYAPRQAEYTGQEPEGFTGNGWGFNIVAGGADPGDEGQPVRFQVSLGDGVEPSGNLYKITPSGNWVGPISYTTEGPTVNITLNIDANGDIDPLFVFGQDTLAPDSVGSFTIVAVTGNVTLTWSNPDTSIARNIDFAGVTVRRNTGSVPAEDGGVEVASGDITTYQDTSASLSDSTTYYYAVYAYDTETPPNYSDGMNGYVNTDFTPPDPGSLFTAESTLGNQGSSVLIRWSKSVDDILGGDLDEYRLYRSTTTSNVYAMTLLRTVRARRDNVSIVDDSGIVKDTTYYYALTGVDRNGNESYATALTAEATVSDTKAPPGVSNLIADVTTDDVGLTWTNPSDLSDVSYNVLVRKVGSYPSSPTDGTVLWSSGLTENYTDLSVPQGTDYFYSVYTVDDSGNASGKLSKVIHRGADNFGSGTYSASSQYGAFGTKSSYAASMTVASDKGTVGDVVFDSATAWRCDLQLADGENILTITSYLYDGSILAQYEKTVIVDMIPPAPPLVIINGQALREGGIVYINTAELQVKGTAEPGVRIQMQTAAVGKLGIQAVVDAGLANTDALGNYELELELSEGVNEVSITATDLAGNKTIISGRIVLDSSAPTIEQITVDDNRISTGDVIPASPLIKVTLVDSVAGIDASAVTLSIDDVPVAVETTIVSGDNLVIELRYQVSTPLSTATTHKVMVEVRDRAGNESVISVSDLTVSDAQEAAIIGEVLNYPNPFNPETETTKIAYSLSAQADIDIYIYTLTGQRLIHKVIQSGDEGARIGYNEVQWDGRNSFGDLVGNGLYLVRIVADDSGSKKLLGKVKVLVMR